MTIFCLYEIKLIAEDHVCIVAVCMSVHYGSIESVSSCIGSEEFMRMTCVGCCIYCIGAGYRSSKSYVQKD